MGLLHSLRTGLLYLAILLALLSFTKWFTQWRDTRVEENYRFSRSQFFIAHVLDPNTDGYRFTSWNRQEWLNWLSRRETSSKGKVPLTEKGINTVLISTPAEFLNAFPGYLQNNDDVDYWGDTLFSSYLFHQSGHGHQKKMQVYRCPPMYVQVKFVKKVPVHLAKHSKQKDAQHKVKPSKDCVLIT